MSKSEAAERFERLHGDILTSYADGLREASNPLVSDAEVWAECRIQAQAILDDCTLALRQGEARLDAQGGARGGARGGVQGGAHEQAAPSGDAIFFSAALGARRALQQLPVVESLRAAALLGDGVLDALRRVLADEPAETAFELFSLAVTALNRSIATRVQSAAIGYDAFLLRRVGEANVGHRSRLARDIHDHLGNGLSLALRCLELHEAEQSPHRDGRDRLQDARNALGDTLDFTRALVSGLRIVLPETGLRALITEFADTAAPRGIEVRVEVNGDESWLRDHYRQELFLTVRECLRNAFTHSGASRVAVGLSVAPHSIDVLIEDDGRGVDTGSRSFQAGGGIRAMRERVTSLGGSLWLTTEPGAGTRVRVRVPLPVSDDANGVAV